MSKPGTVGCCISYPKSGRTWLRFMLSTLGVELDYTHLGTGASSQEWGLSFNELSLEVGSYLHIIFLHRDPRDVVVSFYHEMRSRQMPKRKSKTLEAYALAGKLPPEDLDTFVRSERFGIDKICKFNLWCAASLSGAFWLSYEELSLNPEMELASLLRFLGASASHNKIEQAVALGSFESMKQIERRGEGIPTALHGRLGPVIPNNQNSYKVRRGIVGNWRTEMAPETISYVDARLMSFNYYAQMNLSRNI